MSALSDINKQTFIWPTFPAHRWIINLWKVHWQENVNVFAWLHFYYDLKINWVVIVLVLRLPEELISLQREKKLWFLRCNRQLFRNDPCLNYNDTHAISQLLIEWTMVLWIARVVHLEVTFVVRPDALLSSMMDLHLVFCAWYVVFKYVVRTGI